jgi:uncharacterized protein (TIGR02145 family)
MKALLIFLLLTLIGCSNDPFENSDHGTFTDSRDNNDYKWVRIGEQVWMAENLAYLPAVNSSENSSETSPNYYVYGYDGNDVENAKASDNFSIYGVLYNWAAAKTVCPSGWRLPSQAGWTIMTDFLGESVGGKMKETGTDHWYSPNLGATNTSGFKALPGGFRGSELQLYSYVGYFTDMTYTASFWSSSEYDSLRAERKLLDYNSDGTYWIDAPKRYGFSVRCLKNQ